MPAVSVAVGAGTAACPLPLMCSTIKGPERSGCVALLAASRPASRPASRRAHRHPGRRAICVTTGVPTGRPSGVVTEFEFRGRPLPREVYAGAAMYRRARWADALATYAAWARTIPDDLTTIVTFMTPPDVWVPSSLEGEPMLLLSFCWARPDLAEGERAVADLLAADPAPDHLAVGAIPWLELQSSADAGFPRGVHAYFKSTYVDALDEATIAVLVEQMRREGFGDMLAGIGPEARAPG